MSGAAGAATVQVKAGDTTPDAGGCGSKANPCDTIQAGVDNAATGDVVKVGKGDYAEDVTISTPGITLRGAGTLRGSPSPVCPGDPTRTLFVGGPGTEACRSLADQTSCETGWHLAGRDGTPPTSCFWDDVEGCRGCGPSNEGDALCTNSCEPLVPAALAIAADDVTIQKLRIRAPRVRGVLVLPAVQNASLEKLRVEGPGSDCIAGFGDGLTVEKSSLRACTADCIEAAGAGSRIERNRLLGCGDTAIDSRGDDTRIARNSVRLAGDGIRFLGNRASVERNQVSLTEAGILGVGRETVVVRNQTRATSDGISYQCDSCSDATRTVLAGGPDTEACRSLSDQATCEVAWHLGGGGIASCFWDTDAAECRGCGPNNEDGGDCTNTCVGGEACEGLVSGNRVSEALGDCLDLFAVDSGLVVERNRATGCEDEGIELAGIGIVARSNTVVDCGNDAQDHGIRVSEGLDVVVEDSSVRGCSGDGFHVEPDAENTTFSNNVAQDNGQDGFDVDGSFGTTIERATAKNNVANGIEVGIDSEGTSVINSRATGNLVDFCDQGTATTESGNQFGTTSATCPPDGGEGQN